MFFGSIVGTENTKLTNARILLRSYALAVSNKNPNTTAVAKPFRATQAHQDQIRMSD